jgi:hypothetical protein
MDEFILKNYLKWIPYNRFKNVEYLDKGGFSTIYKAIWLDNNNDVVLKYCSNLNENLNEFLYIYIFILFIITYTNILLFFIVGISWK